MPGTLIQNHNQIYASLPLPNSRWSIYAGLLAAAFGPAYTYMLLRLVYGQRWSETEAPRALAAYCLYILLLAVNGIFEAFVHAVADSRCADCLKAISTACPCAAEMWTG